ncbi:MAG: HEPN domain-containing protein [Phycisphaerales bacterium]|nr:HEPN domain-containing protein [Phycisphaerales bacterium]
MKWTEQSQTMLAKAEVDAYAAKVLAADASMDTAVIGFHAQQAAEKYLKAVLCRFEEPFPKTHDLQTLLDIMMQRTAVPAEVNEVCFLQPYAVELRYDDLPPPLWGHISAPTVCSNSSRSSGIGPRVYSETIWGLNIPSRSSKKICSKSRVQVT